MMDWQDTYRAKPAATGCDLQRTAGICDSTFSANAVWIAFE
jgi:hypothetical protein